jgi:hypothetical protein
MSFDNPSSERPEYVEQLRAEIRGVPYRPAKRKKAEPESPELADARCLFTVESGNRWIDLGAREPKAKMLLGECWHQGELCILFADTNAGKSVLAVQIGENIARAQNTGPFACDAGPENVLYVDFELSTTQFYQRYSHPEQGGHNFSNNFFRAQFNPSADIPENFKSFDDFLIAGLEYKINLVKATVLIIDNITCLRSGTESAAVALRLMNNLKSLKADHKLSILVLAHTPKRRNAAQPLSANDLHGSKLLINFADSAIAMGKSKTDNTLCYLKQIKQRNTRQCYGEDNVALCRLTQPGNFLHFTFEGNSTEQAQLQAAGRHSYNRSTIDREELAKCINELNAEGLTVRDIAERLRISKSTVHNLLQTEESRITNARSPQGPDVQADEKAVGRHTDTSAAPSAEGAIPSGTVAKRRPREPQWKISRALLRPKHPEAPQGVAENGPP